jgi:hypothetical protein
LAFILDEVRAFGLPAPLHLGESFLDFLDQGDEECPGESDHNLDAGPLGCTSHSGYFYRGIGWYTVGEEIGAVTTMDAIHVADFQMLSAEGAEFSGGGHLLYHSTQTYTDIDYDFELLGSWKNESRTDWLGVGYSGLLYGLGQERGEDFYLWLNGGLAIGPHVLNFQSLEWDSTLDCGLHPGGAIEIRDEQGFWYHWDLSDSCGTGCGLVTYDGQHVGELCYDISTEGMKNFRRMGPHAPGAPSLL